MFRVPQAWWRRSVNKPMHADASRCWLVSHHIQSSTVFVFGMTQAASKAVATVTQAESAARLQTAMSSQNQDLAASLSQSTVERPRPRCCHPWACSTRWQT
jgi:predicted deacetylase